MCVGKLLAMRVVSMLAIFSGRAGNNEINKNYEQIKLRATINFDNKQTASEEGEGESGREGELPAAVQQVTMAAIVEEGENGKSKMAHGIGGKLKTCL